MALLQLNSQIEEENLTSWSLMKLMPAHERLGSSVTGWSVRLTARHIIILRSTVAKLHMLHVYRTWYPHKRCTNTQVYHCRV